MSCQLLESHESPTSTADGRVMLATLTYHESSEGTSMYATLQAVFDRANRLSCLFVMNHLPQQMGQHLLLVADILDNLSRSRGEALIPPA